MKRFPKTAALACAALLTTSCTGRYTVRSGYYSPSPRPAPASPPRIALLAPLDYPEVLSWGLVVCNSKLTAGRAYLDAVEAALNSVYGKVSRAGSLAGAKGADYAVEVGPLPHPYQLRFLDPDSGRLVAEFSSPGDERLAQVVSRAKSNGFGNAVTILLFPLALPMCAAIMGSEMQGAGRSFEKGSSDALESLMRSIASDGRVMLSPKAKLRLDELEARGDEFLKTGDAAAALGAFADAAALARGLGTRERTLAVKAARAAGKGGAPAVPEEARRLLARGQAYFKQAASPADYAAAIAEIERALGLAPWWASAHFNAGLAHEGAGNWREAAGHFEAYLAASPGAADAAEVRGKLAELEVRAERGEKAAGSR
ncbi:MAG: hypothetical protein HY925_00220 [Elusimicrobia bacterium]|nr:hypothetical protein [Elusimicrobiota bacterium]